jgi:hypothetical protein
MHSREWGIGLAINVCIVIVSACDVYSEDVLANLSDANDAAIAYYDYDSGLNTVVDDTITKTTGSETRTDNSVIGGTCGDGQVTGTELCDTGIAAGNPGACPSECISNLLCFVSTLRGSGCYTVCMLEEVACKDGDACCPATCSPSTDSDCSVSCGDGIVQIDRGEICEPSSAIGQNSGTVACPTSCPDDGNACTKESVVGSETNCNAHCTSTLIGSLIPGDGCCPYGANANQDTDCTSVCGNGIVEAGEQCDGEANCDSYCKTLQGSNSRTCPEKFSETRECSSCLCGSCASEIEHCFGSGDSKRDADCAAVVLCGLANDCVGSACYCGNAGVSILGSCLTIFADGPCKSEIEKAAGTTDMVNIFSQRGDLNTAVGRATAFTDCHISQCGGC